MMIGEKPRPGQRLPRKPAVRPRAIGLDQFPIQQRQGPKLQFKTIAPMSPAIMSLAEQGLVAGPVFGVLCALYQAHLAATGASAPNPATHEIIRQIAAWHGHFMHNYYITPNQHALMWLLAIPAITWVVGLVVGLVVLGVRSQRARRIKSR